MVLVRHDLFPDFVPELSLDRNSDRSMTEVLDPVAVDEGGDGSMRALLRRPQGSCNVGPLFSIPGCDASAAPRRAALNLQSLRH